MEDVGRGSEVVAWSVVWGAVSLVVHIEDSSCCILDRTAGTNVNKYLAGGREATLTLNISDIGTRLWSLK